MIDILPIAGMIFSLLLALIIGGFILVFPLTRRLGKLLEIRMEERRQAVEAEAGPSVPRRDLAVLRDVIEALQGEVAALAERQQFVEGLLERGPRGVLDAGSRAGAEPEPAREGRAPAPDEAP